jgi:succinate-semialdehyde dehydrogenase/glutarate-semialdehyde dehydrogenase
VINAEARVRIERLIADAVDKGGRIVTDGNVPDGPGFFVPATVIDHVGGDAAMLSEEIFAPVAPIIRFTDENEAIALANATDYGLISYVYTRDLAHGLRVSEALEAGMVALNRGVLSDPSAPFGGVKMSGLGREGAHEGILEYTEQKYVATSW